MTARQEAFSAPVAPLPEEDLRWVRPPDRIAGFSSLQHGDYVRYVHPESFWEKAKRKTKANPLVPIGIAMTTAALTFGLISMRQGNIVRSQQMMRARVTAQGFTVVAMVLGVLYAGAAAK